MSLSSVGNSNDKIVLEKILRAELCVSDINAQIVRKVPYQIATNRKILEINQKS